MKVVRYQRGNDVGVGVRDAEDGIHPTGYRELRELLGAADPLGILRRSLDGPMSSSTAWSHLWRTGARSSPPVATTRVTWRRSV